MIKIKLFLPQTLCFLADLSLMAWSYSHITNYILYSQLIKGKIDSLNFQIQLYRILLQSLTFTLILLAVAQAIIYFLSWKKTPSASAFSYLKFICILGFIFSVYTTVRHSYFAMLPAGIYIFGYLSFSERLGRVPK